MGFNPVQKMCKDQVVGGTVGGWRLVIWTTMYTSMVNPPPPKSKVLMVNWKLWVMSWSALRLVKIFAFSITVGTFESNSCVCEYQMILMGFYQAYFTDINCQKVYSQQDGKTQLIFKRGLALSGRLFQMKPIYNLLEPFEFTFPGHVFLWPMDRYRSSLPSTSSPTVSGEAGKPRCEKWILRKAVLTTSEKTWRWETHMQKSHSFMSSHGFMSQSK